MPADPLGDDFAAVLFDLDGTLIDSTAAVLRSWEAWARGRGVPTPAISHGVPGRQVLADLVAPEELEPAFRELEQRETTLLGGLTVLPGAREALAALAPDGAPQYAAIVTSGTPPLVRARLGATGLGAPRVVVTADDVPRGKPDPAPYLLAAERLGVDPADCLVVEDAPAGLVSGRAAGCATLAVATSHPAAELDAWADVVIASLDAVRFELGDARVRVRRGGAPA